MPNAAVRLPALVVLRRATASLRWGAGAVDAMLGSHPRFAATALGNVETALELYRARPYPLVLIEWAMLGAREFVRRVRQLPGGDRSWICAVAHDITETPGAGPEGVDEWMRELDETHYRSRLDAAAAELKRRGWDGAEVGHEELSATEDSRDHVDEGVEGLSDRLVLEDLLSQFPGLVYVLRATGDRRTAQFDLISQGGASLYGVEHADMLADPSMLMRMIHPDDMPTYVAVAGQSTRTLEPMHCELRICGADGVVRCADVRAVGRRYPNGDVGWTGIMLDITARRQAEELLRGAKDTAEAASRAKSMFLGNVSHELRTPMSAILGLVDLLVEDEAEPRRRRHLETVRDSSIHVLALLDDLLDLQRIEAGRLELAIVPFDPRRLFADIVTLMEPLAAIHALRLSLDVAPELPLSLAGDPVRIRQVVTNLIGNALKFSDTGGRVSIDVGFRSVGAAGVLSAIVRDTGLGVPESDRTRIFETFEQGDTGSARSRGGLGLGLPISRRLAERMGGSLELVESELGRGSAFRFECRLELPADAPVSISRPAIPPVSRKQLTTGRPILVAEDHPFNREVMLALLERLGLVADVALDGAQAVELTANGLYSLVLMDWQMPVLDGLAATARIRQREQARGSDRLPIVAVTAHAVAGTRQRCLEAGMDDVLNKPITLTTLAAVLSRWIGPGRTIAVEPELEPALDVTILGSLPRDRRDRLVALFLDDIPARVFALRDAAAQADVERIRSEAHCLAGASAFLDAVTMRALCDEIDAHARADAPAHVSDAIERLAAEFQRVRDGLTALAAQSS